MKKKLLSIVVVAIVVVATGWIFNQQEKSAVVFNLALENVEALANGESGGGYCCEQDRPEYHPIDL